MNPAQAKGFCVKAEGILRPLGWHIGLTGSQLYGHHDTNHKPSPDLDIIIYPHVENDGTSKSQDHPPFETLRALGILDIKHIEPNGETNYYGIVRYLYIGKLADGTKLDAFFLS